LGKGFRIPPQAARLFPEGVEPGEVGKSVWVGREVGAAVPEGAGVPGLEVASPFVIGRLLEDGDGADLRWLFSQLPEDAAAAWLRERGGRQLSERSRAFWEVVLGVPAGPASEAARELWPL
jgi:hypothetical protein